MPNSRVDSRLGVTTFMATFINRASAALTWMSQRVACYYNPLFPITYHSQSSFSHSFLLQFSFSHPFLSQSLGPIFGHIHGML